MGWASGSRLFSGVIRAIKPAVADKEQRKAIYRELIDLFRDQDWDTEDECLGVDEAYDELYSEAYPEDEEFP